MRNLVNKTLYAVLRETLRLAVAVGMLAPTRAAFRGLAADLAGDLAL